MATWPVLCSNSCHVCLWFGAVPTSTSFVVTTTPRLLTFGDEPRHVDIRGWRYGPRRLRVNDDDSDRRHEVGYVWPVQIHTCRSVCRGWACGKLKVGLVSVCRSGTVQNFQFRWVRFPWHCAAQSTACPSCLLFSWQMLDITCPWLLVEGLQLRNCWSNSDIVHAIFNRPYWVVRSRLWYDVPSVCRLSVCNVLYCG